MPPFKSAVVQDRNLILESFKEFWLLGGAIGGVKRLPNCLKNASCSPDNATAITDWEPKEHNWPCSPEDECYIFSPCQSHDDNHRQL